MYFSKKENKYFLKKKKDTEDKNNRKNKKIDKQIEKGSEKKLNEEQISEKVEKMKNKSLADCPLTEHRR